MSDNIKPIAKVVEVDFTNLKRFPKPVTPPAELTELERIAKENKIKQEKMQAVRTKENKTVIRDYKLNPKK